MTATSISLESPLVPVGTQLLRYANRAGIHMFQPEESDKILTVIGNRDQGAVTLVFSVCGVSWHLSIHKWFLQIPLVQWIFFLWLTD